MKWGRLAVPALAPLIGTGGCTAIGAGSISSVNLTVGEDISHSNSAYTGILAFMAAVDVFLLVAQATGEIEIFGQNSRGIETDLARGEGPFIDDLAQALALSKDEVPRLGAQLRRHRATLLGAMRQSAAPTVYAENLRTALETALAEDPALTERLHAARARLSAAR